jgi:anthranilate synthase component 1
MKEDVKPNMSEREISDALEHEETDAVILTFNIDTDIQPTEAYASLREYDETGYTYLLESAENEEEYFGEKEKDTDKMTDRGRFSFIGFQPSAVIKAGNGRANISHISNRSQISLSETVENEGKIAEGKDPLDVLREALPEISISNEGEARFTGGLVGFHPYEMVYDTKPIEKQQDDTPKSVFIFSDRFLTFDHKKQETNFSYLLRASGDVSEQYDKAIDIAEDVREKLSNHKKISSALKVIGTSFDERNQYEEMVEDVRQHVMKGDIYQGVVSRKKRFEISGEPLSIYEKLRKENPSPYMYVLEFEDVGVLGASPETLAKVEDDEVTTNPIAGTVSRGDTVLEDRKLEGEMLSDEKERSEHVMLVDLGRNDINRVSKPGSVKVERFMEVLQYSTVQHLESIVSGQLTKEKDAFDAMRSVFPAGTLSGAPKVRAMEIIAEQETEPRGLYGGAVGYYSLNGNMDSAITIRTMMFNKKSDNQFEAAVQAGAGIVADSQPEKEFRETNQKMNSITTVIQELDQRKGDGG